MPYLEKSEQMKLDECVLQLDVKSKGDSKHAYMVRFKVGDENKLEDLLQKDLLVLIHLAKERAHNENFNVNGRVYNAVEVNDLAGNASTRISTYTATNLKIPEKTSPLPVTSPKIDSVPEPLKPFTSPEPKVEYAINDETLTVREKAKLNPNKPKSKE